MEHANNVFCTGHLNDGRRFFAELTSGQFAGYSDEPFCATIDNVTGSIDVLETTVSNVRDMMRSTPSMERTIIWSEEPPLPPGFPRPFVPRSRPKTIGELLANKGFILKGETKP